MRPRRLDHGSGSLHRTELANHSAAVLPRRRFSEIYIYDVSLGTQAPVVVPTEKLFTTTPWRVPRVRYRRVILDRVGGVDYPASLDKSSRRHHRHQKAFYDIEWRGISRRVAFSRSSIPHRLSGPHDRRASCHRKSRFTTGSPK